MNTCVVCEEEKARLLTIFIENDYNDSVDEDSGKRICKDCVKESEIYALCPHCPDSSAYLKRNLVPLILQGDRYLLCCPDCRDEWQEPASNPEREDEEERRQDEQDYTEYLYKDS